MTKGKVLIVQNISREGPGLLELILKEKRIRFDIADLDLGHEFPNPKEYDAVFVFGGPDSANDKTPKMIDELTKIKETVQSGKPYFGVCLGMQTLVKANGGEVYKNPVKEIGFRDPKGDYFEIDSTNDGKEDPIFYGLKFPLKIFHLHGETVHLAEGMTLLATGKYCPNQVVKVGNTAYGFQGHLELTDTMLKQWIAQDPDLKPINPDSLRLDYGTLKPEYENNGVTIFKNFLKIANLI